MKASLTLWQYVVGSFKRHEEDFSQLDVVGHAPVELSLLDQFLKAAVGNSIYVEMIRKRKREVGPVVPEKFLPCKICNWTAKVLDEQLLKRKQHFSTLELKHRKKGSYRKFSVYRI